MKFSSEKKGFTLVELLLYIVIIGVILTVVSVFFTTILTSRIKNETISEVEFQGLQVLQVITQTLRNANGVKEPLRGETSSLLRVNKGGENIIFAVDDGVIYIQERGESINLTNNRVMVSDIIFENLGKEDSTDSIRIHFNLSHINYTGRNEYSFERYFTGAASLRNFNHDL